MGRKVHARGPIVGQKLFYNADVWTDARLEQFETFGFSEVYEATEEEV